MSKKITVVVNGPHLPLGGERRTFRSLRTARIWVKSHVRSQPCGWSVVDCHGWYGSKSFDIPNPITKAWQQAVKHVFEL